jgi:hypothetical protein
MAARSALEHDERFGSSFTVEGGLSGRERRRLKRAAATGRGVPV